VSTVEGTCDSRHARVRDAFAENFARRELTDTALERVTREIETLETSSNFRALAAALRQIS